MANQKEIYRIQGMDCAEEVSQLRRALGGVTGIYDLGFDVMNGKMTVEFDRDRMAPGAIQTAVAGLGMKAVAWDALDSLPARELAGVRALFARPSAFVE